MTTQISGPLERVSAFDRGKTPVEINRERFKTETVLLAEYVINSPAAGRADGFRVSENRPARPDDLRPWSDARLVAAVRQEPPNEAALEVLVERHCKALFSRCLILTMNQPNAADLAQSTWCRVLRSRQRLNPEKRFGAYLATIATNLWRDSIRRSFRAGPMAENRLISLNQVFRGEEDPVAVSLMDTLPSLPAAAERNCRHLAIDIDQALASLTPRQREVLVARHLTGESCAEIARRYGCTEQTVSSWVRAAVKKMKHQLAEPGCIARQRLRG
jgi:RNA polymerase sigma-70 factor (ECF subfamily)